MSTIYEAAERALDDANINASPGKDEPYPTYICAYNGNAGMT